MVRRYSSSFHPAWAVNVPAQNSNQSETETSSTRRVEKARNPSDGDKIQARGKSRDEIYPAVASGLPPEEVKTRGRSYSKIFPSSWALSSEAKPPPTNIIDYGNSVHAMGVPKAPQKFPARPGPQSYSRQQTNISSALDEPRYKFSAESGEGDAAPRPPEGYKAETYPTHWDSRNRIPSSESGNRSHNIPQITSYRPYGMPSTSAITTSSGSGDVPARAPPVSSTYSSII